MRKANKQTFKNELKGQHCNIGIIAIQTVDRQQIIRQPYVMTVVCTSLLIKIEAKVGRLRIPY